jgi:hypothetical protein
MRQPAPSNDLAAVERVQTRVQVAKLDGPSVVGREFSA